MIVVYGPFSHPQHVRDGWMRRIAAVDRIFADRERHYVFPLDPLTLADWRDYRLQRREVAPGATFTFLDFRFAHHQRHLTELVHDAEFVYAHTSHSSQYLLPYYGTGKIVTDLHGIAPEEEELQGKPGRAAFYAGFEEIMVRQSAVLVTVTRAMAEHVRRKYPGSDRPTIELPIVEDMGTDLVAERPARARPVVVYVGGLQHWQNVDLMLRTVAACRERCEFRFYTHAPDELRRRAAAAGVGGALHVDVATPEQLPAIYAAADFGFVLRDDIAVNRVSCPTKLSEYLALGVLPVVTLAEIGDFAALGYRWLSLDDLLHGRLPDAATAAAMRRQNREVFAAIQQAFADGERRLRELVLPATRLPPASTFLTSLERTAFFPVARATLRVVRDDGAHDVVLDDLVGARVDLDLALPGAGRVHALRLSPGAAPFVTTPIHAELLDASGRATPVALQGGHTPDAHGNWCFHERRAHLVGSAPEPADAVRVRLRWEYLLVGPEALVACAQVPSPRNVWLDGLRLCGSLVPGARPAWTALNRLLGR